MDTVKTFKKEAKNLFVTVYKDDIDKIHKIQLEILNDFISFCDCHNLTYYLTGGSALGAIRHKGFIPWDDDIDIVMPRSDYDQLRNIFPSQFNEKYSVEAPMLENTGSVQFMKIRKKGTILRGLMSIGPDFGVFIDIFPLDYAPNSKLHRQLCNAGYFLIKSLPYSIVFYKLYDKIFKPHEKECSRYLRFRMKIKRLWGMILSIRPLSKWLNEFDTMVQKKESNYYVVPSGIHSYTKECFPVECFYPPRKAEFENLKINIPNKTEVIMEAFYGDYMSPPKNISYELKCFIDVNLTGDISSKY